MTAVNGNFLALDLASRCGWAVRLRDGTVFHGTEDFRPRENWTPGQRWTRFRSWLAALVVRHQITDIAYEVVMQGQGHSSVAAGDVYGGFKCLVELAADSHNLNLHPFHVSTVKKFWTGDGRAKKPQMIATARERGFVPKDDNAADALAVLHLALAAETGEWTPAPKKPKAKPGTTVRRRPAATATELFG